MDVFQDMVFISVCLSLSVTVSVFPFSSLSLKTAVFLVDLGEKKKSGRIAPITKDCLTHCQRQHYITPCRVSFLKIIQLSKTLPGVKKCWLQMGDRTEPQKRRKKKTDVR